MVRLFNKVCGAWFNCVNPIVFCLEKKKVMEIAGKNVFRPIGLTRACAH